MTAPIRSMPELVDAIRARRDELNISHETIDNIAGLQSGYTSKLLGPIQLKGFSHMSLGAVLGALGIGLTVVEDKEARAKVEGRWEQRKRPQRLVPASIPASIENEVPKKLAVTPELKRQLVDLDHMKRIAKLGAKRRNKIMGKRARQRAASHAARIRWAKRDLNRHSGVV
jgi:hypothetical protein